MRHHHARGFTLIEAALTTVIIGTGVLAMVSAQTAYHKKNDWAQLSGTGLLLANEIREMTLALPMHDPVSGNVNMGAEANELTVADYDDLDDFAGVVDGFGIGSGLIFNPPINGLRLPIDAMDNWSQRVDVVNVFKDNIDSTLAQPLGSTDMMRVTVAVFFQKPGENTPTPITQLTWVISNK